jgi:hypothetical protein
VVYIGENGLAVPLALFAATAGIPFADPACGAGVPDAAEPDPDDEAVLLMTSGTTAEPKSAELRHRHLVCYIFGSVEFGARAAGSRSQAPSGAPTRWWSRRRSPGS